MADAGGGWAVTGDEMRELRGRMGLTQSALALALDLDVELIAAMERSNCTRIVEYAIRYLALPKDGQTDTRSMYCARWERADRVLFEPETLSKFRANVTAKGKAMAGDRPRKYEIVPVTVTITERKMR